MNHPTDVSHGTIWIGIHERGWAFVYDPELQLSDEATWGGEINIYLIGEGKARAISPSAIRSSVKALVGTARDDGLKEYLEWKSKHAGAFKERIAAINLQSVRRTQESRRIAQESRRIASEEEKRKFDARVLAHQRFTERRGVNGALLVPLNEHCLSRISQCYVCGNFLIRDLQCNRCNYIPCTNCGACFCKSI